MQLLFLNILGKKYILKKNQTSSIVFWDYQDNFKFFLREIFAIEKHKKNKKSTNKTKARE